MLNRDDKVALINPFISNEPGPLVKELAKENKPALINDLLSHYFLDASSCLAPKLLPIAPNSHVLDMCSAPGGKLLYLISRSIANCHFVANDISKARLLRLRKMINSYVPLSFQRYYIQFINHDANYFGQKCANIFDAILLDAPCSSEAHVLKDLKLRKNFTGPQKSLPKRQYSLLCSALLALKKGGYVMYATCSINPKENQGVIERLLKKKGEQCVVVPLTSPLGLRDQYGLSVLPHLHKAGPAFLSLIKKTGDDYCRTQAS
jgi:5-methylcytosine rRNA methyltransferase NSUN4